MVVSRIMCVVRAVCVCVCAVSRERRAADIRCHTSHTSHTHHTHTGVSVTKVAKACSVATRGEGRYEELEREEHTR